MENIEVIKKNVDSYSDSIIRIHNYIEQAKQKEFYDMCGINTTNKEWEDNGFCVINFSMVRSEYMKLISNKELADRFHLYNPYCDNDSELKEIHDKFNKIVFKESRGSSCCKAIGWENINSYLSYHSGIHYKWFKK